MSKTPDFTGIRAFVDGANLAFPNQRTGRKQPDARHLTRAIASLGERLPGAEIGILVDSSIWGWMEGRNTRADLEPLRRLQRAGKLAVAPKKTKADPFLLELAGSKRGILVSNDAFEGPRQRTLRINIPILTGTELFGDFEWHPRFLFYQDEHTKQPRELTDFEAIAHCVAGKERIDAIEATPTSEIESTQPESPPPVTRDIEGVCAHLTELAGPDGRVRFDHAASWLPVPFDGRWKAFLADVVGGPVVGRFTRFCESHLPGWQLDSDSEGKCWLRRTVAALPEPQPDECASKPDEVAGRELTLADIERHLVALVDERQRLSLASAPQRLRAHFGRAFDKHLAQSAPGRVAGRWLRYCEQHLARWTIEYERDTPAWLIPPEEAEPPLAVSPALRPLAPELLPPGKLPSPEAFLDNVWQICSPEELASGVELRTLINRYRDAGYHWSQREWETRSLSRALRRAALGRPFAFDSNDRDVIVTVTSA